MTHAECQDLLLDLAYGEPGPRGAEVLSHVAGCADCQRELAQIAGTRMVASPLRESEEPSPDFDARILAAARAEANLQSGGLPGQVIEVKGTVRPLGLEAARIDAHSVAASPAGKRKPRWAMRLLLGGSIAAAAGLALVLSTTLQSRKQEQKDAAKYEIRVEAVAQKAQAEAVARAESRAAEAPPAAPAPAPKPAAEEERGVAVADKKMAARRKEAKPPRDELQEGGGGDVADRLAAREAPSHAAGAGAASAGAVTGEPAAPQAAIAQKPEPVAAAEPQPAAPALKPAAPALQTAPALKTAPPPPAGTALQPVALAAQPARAMPMPPAEMKKLAVAAPAAAAEVSASELESQAQSARHAAHYVLAASLYRKAALLRQAATEDAGTAAWDLAHEIECLAAAGLFEQARQVRADLQSLYPAEATPISAANRALQSADLPAPAPTSTSPARTSPAEAQPKAKPADEAEAH